MRISDWSSDVCSSDLTEDAAPRAAAFSSAARRSREWAALPSGRGPPSRKPLRRSSPSFQPFGCGPPPGRARQVASRRPPPLRRGPAGFGAGWRNDMRKKVKGGNRPNRRPSRGGEPRASLYDSVTNRIISELEQGRLPWVQPWCRSGGASAALPHNARSGRAYSGINILILWGAVIEAGWPCQGWLTFRQALEAGGNVRKGERGPTVVYAESGRASCRERVCQYV